MKPITVGVLTSVALAVATDGLAQNGKQVWVASRAILDVDQSIFSSTTAVGPGVGVAFGIDARQFGFQIALDWPVPHTKEYVDTFPESVQGQERVTVRTTRSSPSWNALVAIHPWSGSHVRISALAGMANVTHRYAGYSAIVERLGADGQVVSRTETPFRASTYWWPGLMFGADAAIRLGPRMDFVPEVQMIVFPLADHEGKIFRSAAALRWTL